MTRAQRRFVWFQTPAIVLVVVMVIISRAKIFTDRWMDASVAVCGILFVVAYVRGYRDAGRQGSN